MRSVRLLTNLLIATLVMVSCHRQEVDTTPLVAEACGYELHTSDLAGLVAEGVSPEDSSAIVNGYIDQWIRQTVLLAKAEKNINDDFERQLREYKNSLLTYAYEEEVLAQLLDTTVSESQVAEYYNQHSEDFHLKNAIVKAVYVIVPNKAASLAKLKKIIQKHDFDDHDVVELEETASRHGNTGYYDADTWIPFHTLQSAVPITAYNEGLFLRQNRSIVLHDDSLTYVVRILDYKVGDEISPLEMETDNIKSIIINHRKIDILDRLHSDLIKEAQENGKVKRYK